MEDSEDSDINALSGDENFDHDDDDSFDEDPDKIEIPGGGTSLEHARTLANTTTLRPSSFSNSGSSSSTAPSSHIPSTHLPSHQSTPLFDPSLFLSNPFNPNSLDSLSSLHQLLSSAQLYPKMDSLSLQNFNSNPNAFLQLYGAMLGTKISSAFKNDFALYLCKSINLKYSKTPFKFEWQNSWIAQNFLTFFH
jgi:hypothetical protein